MSSTGAPGGAATPAAAAAPHRYFCHQCDRTVALTPSPTGDLSCPLCHGGFVEEFDLPNPSPSPFFSFQTSTDSFFPSAFPLPLHFASSPTPASSFDIRNPNDLSGLFGGGGGDRSSFFRASSTAAGPEPFNPANFLQNYFQNLMADGANIQVVFEGAGGSPLVGNLGDYFIGPGLEQLIQQLAENDPNRYGTPPAAKSVIESLPYVNISQDLIDSDDGAQCAVCKDEFEIGAEAKQMPCKHLYHKDCIVPWLELHNSCPVCRFELPTDDPDYENRRGAATPAGGRSAGGTVEAGGASGVAVAAEAAGGGGGGGTEGNSPGGVRMTERRFRISLPWPFRAMGSGAEASNAGDGVNNSGDSGEGRDGGSGGRGDAGSESRQGYMD